MEEKVLSLVDDNNKLAEQLRHFIKQEAKNESIANTPKPLDVAEYKHEIVNKRITELEEKLREARSIQQEFEVQKVELQNYKIKVGTLEAEKSMLESSKQVVNRAGKVRELERELAQSREIINSLRESVKGKLLMEEQMANLQQR